MRRGRRGGIKKHAISGEKRRRDKEKEEYIPYGNPTAVLVAENFSSSKQRARALDAVAANPNRSATLKEEEEASEEGELGKIIKNGIGGRWGRSEKRRNYFPV